jgi:hypothetical protein
LKYFIFRYDGANALWKEIAKMYETVVHERETRIEPTTTTTKSSSSITDNVSNVILPSNSNQDGVVVRAIGDEIEKTTNSSTNNDFSMSSNLFGDSDVGIPVKQPKKTIKWNAESVFVPSFKSEETK